MHHGMLTVYKEKGYTSSDAVARLRGILRMRKIGHTGTLDPDAEGVLPMCLGNATRICELIADREKEYLAVMRLGVRTDTQDMSGQILSQIPDQKLLEILGAEEQVLESKEQGSAGSGIPAGQDPAEILSAGRSDTDPETDRMILEKILDAAASFTGEIEQIPPMYSAIKVNGKRLYDMARKGISVERKPRRITIYSLTVEKVELPLVTMRVRCSKGTYIRTLCEDLGSALRTGAAMQSLLRTRVGNFTLEEALTLDRLEEIAKSDPVLLSGLIRPVDSFFENLPAAVCRDDALRLLKNGNVLTQRELRFLKPEEDPLRSCKSPKGEGTECAEDGISADSDKCDDKGGNEGASLPGIEPGQQVIRMYDAAGSFYGLYRSSPGQRGRTRFSAYKMFLPES
ncbi:MAG: tRNA pseudouridine(55) synthase TruB [Lachnospiraceae bacterium]|nr:tRNA pseudouridine(55) synthase TruB [Lachnospiraceae bacterium]